ncbi:hypothetical protein [Salinisphaera sp. G21_0]|uniref:hypothetical protein n=1 Tax=Salinisphaera sp. G21_0 TaxID=2821094 RepID=UPI001ADBFB98|nr:hypothetical protein [Salinisphaera sp. G21_0]MBO9484710.1 hypothetical protein [Salinisphaera sp. G21_0]
MFTAPDGLNESSVALANEPDPDEAKALIPDDTAWLLAISDELNPAASAVVADHKAVDNNASEASGGTWLELPSDTARDVSNPASLVARSMAADDIAGVISARSVTVTAVVDTLVDAGSCGVLVSGAMVANACMSEDTTASAPAADAIATTGLLLSAITPGLLPGLPVTGGWPVVNSPLVGVVPLLPLPPDE